VIFLEALENLHREACERREEKMNRIRLRTIFPIEKSSLTMAVLNWGTIIANGTGDRDLSTKCLALESPRNFRQSNS